MQETEVKSMLAELREEIHTLRRRVNDLEQQIARGAVGAPEGSSEEDMLVIAAAVAAFLGVRARIRQVHLVHSSAWAQVGRVGVHASHRIH